MSTLKEKLGVSSVIPIITLITFLIVGCGSPSTTETPFAASETGDSFGSATSGTPRSTAKDSTSSTTTKTTTKTSTNSTASMSTSPSSNNSTAMSPSKPSDKKSNPPSTSPSQSQDKNTYIPNYDHIKHPEPLPAKCYEWKKDHYEPMRIKSNRGTNQTQKVCYWHERCVYPKQSSRDPKRYHEEDLSYGTMLDELFDIRDAIKEVYVLHDEVIDIDPRPFVKSSKNFEEHYENMTGKDSYFQLLRSSIKTEDGSFKHGPFKSRKSTKRLEHQWAAPSSDFTTKYPYVLFFTKPIYVGPPTFGISWEILSDNPPRNYIVRYVATEEGTNSRLRGLQGIKRGDKLLQVNDIDFVNENSDIMVEKIRKGLFPSGIEKSTKFVFEDRDTKEQKLVEVKPTQKYMSSTFQGSKVIDSHGSKIGYINLGDRFYYFKQFYELIKKFKNNSVEDVILDIRYFDHEEKDFNGWERRKNTKLEGMALYTIFGKKHTINKTFYEQTNTTELNERYWTYLIRDDLYNGPSKFRSYCKALTEQSKEDEVCDETWDHFWEGGTDLRHWSWNYRQRRNIEREHFDFPLKSLDLDRIFLLTSKNTCHIGEIILNGLKGIDVEIIQIGDQTCGESYPRGSGYRNCGIFYELLGSESLNHKKEGRYDSGFKPVNKKNIGGITSKGCYVVEDFKNDLGDMEEKLLAAALQYRHDGTCPAVP